MIVKATVKLRASNKSHFLWQGLVMLCNNLQCFSARTAVIYHHNSQSEMNVMSLWKGRAIKEIKGTERWPRSPHCGKMKSGLNNTSVEVPFDFFRQCETVSLIFGVRWGGTQGREGLKREMIMQCRGGTIRMSQWEEEIKVETVRSSATNKTDFCRIDLR